MDIKYLNDNEIKYELKEILKNVDMFLKKNQLKYTIYGGTLLGAVRHQGFIPWDDDVDLGMLRTDYDKLVKLLSEKNQINNNLKGIGFELGEGDWPFIKIVNQNITVKEGKVNISKYLWIDIFPIDGVPNHFQKFYFFRVRYVLRKLFFYKRAQLYKITYSESKSFLKRFVDGIISFTVRFISSELILKIYIRQCSKYDIENSNILSENVWGTKVFPITMFEKTMDFQFEDIVVQGICDYDKYLEILYGNYMKIPPEKERINHDLKARRVQE